MSQAAAKTKNNHEVLILGVSAFLITMFLGFIDEGYYDFRWMTDIWNWVILGIYGVAIFFFQLLFAKLFLARFSGNGKLVVSLIAGAAVGIAFMVTVVFSGVN